MFWKINLQIGLLVVIRIGVWDRWKYSTKLSLKSLFCYWKRLVHSVEFVESKDKTPNNPLCNTSTWHFLQHNGPIFTQYHSFLSILPNKGHCFSTVQISLAWTQWICWCFYCWTEFWRTAQRGKHSSQMHHARTSYQDFLCGSWKHVLTRERGGGTWEL